MAFKTVDASRTAPVEMVQTSLGEFIPKGKPTKDKRYKPKTVVTIARPGIGPFDLARGAAEYVDRIITEWTSEARELLESEEYIGLDLETSGLDWFRGMIAVVGLHGEKTKTAVVLHTVAGIPPGLIEWLSTPGKKFVTQNGVRFDLLWLAKAGVDIYANEYYDTLIGEQIVTGTDRRGIPKDLQAIVNRRLGFTIYKDVDHRGWMNPVLTTQQTRYVAEDISFLTRIRTQQFIRAREIDDTKGLNPFYKTGVSHALELEHRLAPTVLRMQLRGLPVDRDALIEYGATQSLIATEAKAEVDKTFGDVNWNSPNQVKAAFRRIFDADLPNTREDTLIDIAELGIGSAVGEACRTIIIYRHAAKRANMYNESFMDKYAPDGWVRAQFAQAGTDTGRFSSANPNLQQIPKDKGNNDGARHIVGNHPGLQIVAPDYSQIEVRIMANEAEEWEMIKLFQIGETDIHTLVASEVFRKPINEVTKHERQLSKAMSFTLLFGGGAAKMAAYAKSLGADLPMSMARPIVEDFFDRFPRLKDVRRRAYSTAAAGIPFTLNLPTGIRRVLTPGIDLTGTRILNNMVQGTAAAGLKYALLEAQSRGLDKYIGAVVHDEIVAAVPEDEAEEYGKALRECMIEGMIKVCELCPVDVEVSIAPTWGMPPHLRLSA